MDVGSWLRSLGLGQYEANFRDNKIDADLLPRLTVDDLKDIGVSVVGDRRRLLDAIAALAGAGPPADVPASSAKSAASKGLQASAERRPITVMFCDLVGSTSLAAKLDAEDWRNLVNAYLDEASKAVTDFGGHVLKKLGDGLMALFGYPQAQENDAERAVRAALAIQRALAQLNARNANSGAPELLARIGLESGPVVVESAGEVFGEAPNIAARVQAAAEPGSVLITSRVQREVAGLFVADDKGVHELRGLPEPIGLYRIVRASGGRRFGSRALTPLVGREEELDLLRRRWERAVRGEGQLTLLVGEPGIGKSRLVEEFRLSLGETPHTWAEFSSSQLLQNTPLHPIAEWGRQRFGDADTSAGQRFADLENTLQLIGLDPAEHAPLIAPLVDIPLPPDRGGNVPPEELRRRQLAAVIAWFLAGARTQPAALAFEDLHWADPTTLDLMQALAERGAQAPLLILATTRPEFRAPWSLRSHHSVISLSPLNRADVAQMVGELTARHALSKEVVEGVSERTGGVPLFVEEVTRLLLERGEQGGLQAIPPTLQQSLAARLDRLGEAREVAQIGAVLGRDFTYILLRTVGGIDDLALQSALGKLADADLLIAEGGGPHTNYRFKHALIQDAAYDSLLKSRRQALHRRAAELLRNGPEPAVAAPEVIAHHFTQAGLDDLAIEWWGKAGDQALRRSAFQEAIAHLGKAIEMADRACATAQRAPGGSAAPNQRLTQLHIAYGNAAIAARGYGAPETTEAFARARESASGDKDGPERLAADFGLWAGSYTRGESSSMRAHAAAFLSDVEAIPDSPEAGVAHRVAGITCWFAGEYREARDHLESALALFQPGRDDDLAFRFGHDPGVAAMAYLAFASWPLGEVDRAISLIDRTQGRIAGLTHVSTLALGRMHAALFELMRGDHTRAAPNAFKLARLAREQELTMFRAFGVFLEGWATAASGAIGTGLEDMRRGVELRRAQNVLLFDGLLKIALAEAEARAGDPGRAIAILDEALATCDRAGNRAFEAELHRARGEMLLRRDSANAAPAEEAFLTAIAVAKQQGTRSFELRAALSLAKLYQSTGRPVDAHAILAPALEGFSPTSEMPEIAEAQALLAALAQNDEVKAEAARRQRLTQLHVARGLALFATRGGGAPETTEAFAKGREWTFGDENAPGRFVADFGLWVGSYVRGELPSMRGHAVAFLSDVAAKPDSPEAGVAHRTAGITCWFAGEYREARDHLERALALFQPGRDDDQTFRFGLDPGIAAMVNLANASWPLGEVDRAISLIDRAQLRSADFTHAGVRAFARMHAALFDLMRRDRARAAPKAFELAQLAREHELTMYGAFGAFLEGWASAAGGAPGGGLADMRRALDELREQNVLLFDGLLKIALAEAEARAGDSNRALAILDEALATADRLGYRAFKAELHRARGETLLKREPANPAPAEEALQAAIAVAKQQGTRSFDLRASLALAKVYQSTGRPADAHAVLTPALEDFSPTPEMPEIAEAQALLAALSETEEVKAVEAQRQRRVHLQTAFGQAVMWSKGFAAEETKAAFARAAELAGGIDDFSQRFAVFAAQVAAAMTGGELRSARELALTVLREAEETGRTGEAGLANQWLGLTDYWRGDFLEARKHYERAVAARDPNPDLKLLAGDPSTFAVSQSALTAWALGELERARELINTGTRRALESGHIGAIVDALFFQSYLEVWRGDHVATLSAADALQRVAQEHRIAQYLNEAELHLAWARGSINDPMAGAAQIQRGLAAFVDQGVRINLGFYTGLLAQLEAETLGADGALARIDEAFALSNDVEHRCSLPFLHRLRGEILLKRDPPDTARAEEAFVASVAVAKEQGARSPVLLASLSLAKLYQSTARPAEAHAVLAPALEGFSPTPEMPEIAEAQILLVAIEAGAHVRRE
jgi:class 3 adenylate cyclase/predicted ATPase